MTGPIPRLSASPRSNARVINRCRYGLHLCDGILAVGHFLELGEKVGALEAAQFPQPERKDLGSPGCGVPLPGKAYFPQHPLRRDRRGREQHEEVGALIDTLDDLRLPPASLWARTRSRSSPVVWEMKTLGFASMRSGYRCESSVSSPVSPPPDEDHANGHESQEEEFQGKGNGRPAVHEDRGWQDGREIHGGLKEHLVRSPPRR